MNLLLRIGLGIACVVLLVSALLIVLAGLLTDDARNHELT